MNNHLATKLRHIHILLAAACLSLLSPSVYAGAFDDDFVVVFIDAQSEAKYGAFPFDRKWIAEAIDVLADAKAKAVVLKFFYDRPSETVSDQRLAKSFTRLPVALQACLDDTEPKPNPLPARFFLPALKAETAVSGRSGWIPLPLFSEQAKEIGFVDSASTTVPILETYQGQTVKSLVLCSMEMALGKSAVVELGKKITIGQKTWKLDPKNQLTGKLPKADDLKYVPFHQLLDKSAPAKLFAGKVVILGYDGPKIHTLDSAIGKVKAHRMFVYSLKGIYEQASDKVAK